tara:strand:+ start:257 stop:2371 length:2115 start_codon:yes stop_codon:yes gene_type:complete
MKIAILLPYKEDYTPKYSGAVSIHVSNLIKYSKYKSKTTVFGNTLKKNYLSKNFFNIKINKNIFSSNNKKYLEKFIEINKKIPSDLIEVHNRPSYIKLISENLKSYIMLYFHNNPLTLLGSKTLSDRLELLEKCDYIFFNSKWTKNKFFTDIDENNYVSNFGICYQSTKKTKVNIKQKKNIVSFVGKLNTAKGYDIFGGAVLKILNEYPNWKSIVVGDEPREKHIFNHKNLKIFNFKENSYVLNIMKQSSIFVACSRWEEPFGRSSLEASSMACASIITDRGGLLETTKNPIVLKKLDINTLYTEIKKLIDKPKKRMKYQKLNYKSFYLTHEYVSEIIDKARLKISINDKTNKFNINKNAKLKIIHITNFNQRYFGRLQYNTGIRLNNGLIRLGHNVISLSDRDLINASKTFKDPTGSKYLNNLVSETINNFRPDLIILGHADRVENDMLLDAKGKYKNLAVSQWFLDPLSKKGPDYKKNKLRILNKIDAMDCTFITTSPSALDFNIENSYFIPNPCDKSLDNLKNFNQMPYNDIFYAISHGVHRGVLRTGKKDEREIFISKLKNKCKDITFDTYGMFGKQPVWGDNFLNELAKSKMGLNLSRGKPIKYYSSDRLAQLMGNGLLTFIDKKTCYSDFFRKDEMIFYSDLDDLSEKIYKYKKDDKLRRKIARNGNFKYHKYFNSTLVAKFIVDKSMGINSKFYWNK